VSQIVTGEPLATDTWCSVEFRSFYSDNALSIVSGLTAVLNSFTCSDAEKENAIEFVLKQHKARSLERAREKSGL
jgi:hypothetical protein